MKKNFLLTTCFLIAGISFAVQMGTSEFADKIIRSKSTDIRLGRPLGTVDIDNNGTQDLVIGVSGYRTDLEASEHGYVYIVKVDDQFYNAQELNLDSPDLTITTIQAENPQTAFGISLSSGDINGDGIEDLVICDSSVTSTSEGYDGALYVTYGKSDYFDTSIIDFSQNEYDVKINGGRTGESLGGKPNIFGDFSSKALDVADFDQDGCADIAVGAGAATENKKDFAGKVYVFKGSTTLSGEHSLATESYLRILGKTEYQEFGTCVKWADLYGTGNLDLVVSSPSYYSSFYNVTGAVLIFDDISTETGIWNLSSRTPDSIIWGSDAASNYNSTFGDEIAIGDVNSDGNDDLLVLSGSYSADKDQNTATGAAYLFYGKISTASMSMETQSPDVFILGDRQKGYIYSSIAMGDFQGDGDADIMLAARDSNGGIYSGEGRIFIIDGSDALNANLSVISPADIDYIFSGGAQSIQLCDFMISSDLDNDGQDEIISGSPFRDNGTVYIFKDLPTSAQNYQLYQ